MLQKALSNERDVTKKNWSWFWPETVWISLWFLGFATPGGSSVAMFKKDPNIPIHR